MLSRKMLFVLSIVLVGCAKDMSPTSREPGPRPNGVQCHGWRQWDCVLYTKEDVPSQDLEKAKADTEEVAKAYAKEVNKAYAQSSSTLVYTVVEKSRPEGKFRVLTRVFHFPDAIDQ